MSSRRYSPMGKKFNLSDARAIFLRIKRGYRAEACRGAVQQSRQILSDALLAGGQPCGQADAKANARSHVAMTRAREKLILTGMVGQRQYQILISRLKKGGRMLSFSDRLFARQTAISIGYCLRFFAIKMAKVLRSTDVSSFHDCTYLAEDSSFSISVLSASAISSGRRKETEESALFSAIRCHEPRLPNGVEEKESRLVLAFL